MTSRNAIAMAALALATLLSATTLASAANVTLLKPAKPLAGPSFDPGGSDLAQPGEPFFPPGWRDPARPAGSSPDQGTTSGAGGPDNGSAMYSEMNCVASGHEKDALSDLEFWNTGTTVIPAGTVITWTTSEGKTGTLTVPLDLVPGSGMEIWNVVADGWSSAFGCDVTLTFA